MTKKSESNCRRLCEICYWRVKAFGGNGENVGYQHFLLPFTAKISKCSFSRSIKVRIVWWMVKGGPSDLGKKILQKYWKIILILPDPLIFIHKTPVVENHPTTREIGDLLWPRSTPMGITVYFYLSSSLIYVLKIHIQSFKHGIWWSHYGK